MSSHVLRHKGGEGGGLNLYPTRPMHISRGRTWNRTLLGDMAAVDVATGSTPSSSVPAVPAHQNPLTSFPENLEPRVEANTQLSGQTTRGVLSRSEGKWMSR